MAVVTAIVWGTDNNQLKAPVKEMAVAVAAVAPAAIRGFYLTRTASPGLSLQARCTDMHTCYCGEKDEGRRQIRVKGNEEEEEEVVVLKRRRIATNISRRRRWWRRGGKRNIGGALKYSTNSYVATTSTFFPPPFLKVPCPQTMVSVPPVA